ncbi:hypothetical protein [Micromonospora parathelypteridis]|uniref:Thioredoxin domain-containing protein n=1 Tax=Micromonospora parathelypteridis TaxID=1839617 RepID=A0A840VPQ4_9ACTN|nr:hypothetical protein [Micromonospora parathelypteridis]MBB5477956.1 hypothetical protein [Micromonospora parathelypteridis]GGO12543.1 hypothetical protein GCM10011576_21970 [Micromonospora parathelypteridis]
MGKPDAEGHGPADGLPGLPPEWGRVVVPDDASALAAEAAQIRRELRRAAGGGPRALSLPLLVLLVAVLTTLTGLLVVTWPRANRGNDRPTPAPYSPPATLTGRALPALDLVDESEAPVPLRGLLPAVIILVDGCPCPERVADALAAAPAGVSVVTVAGGRTVPPPPSNQRQVRALADPAGGLRSFLGQPVRPGALTALLVDRGGMVTRVLPDLGPVDTYRQDLTALTG